ncbi:MAG TPA: glucan biosynthesis glucosyltransferase H, partial [Casimicrobiaceae bacterium]|nr:glucan biosynthesis glucosyltransferase H [Casimicrobiaceae bacterium]
MAPRAWWSRRAGRSTAQASETRTRTSASPSAGDPARFPWRNEATFRRLVLLGLVLVQTYLATSLMAAVLPNHGTHPLEVAMLALFAILFGFVCGGFWTAIAGFVLLLPPGDRHFISRTAAGDAPI